METATRKSKKADKRKAFTEVFERQARRFSAFDLLGIEPSPSPSSSSKHVNSEEGDSKELVRAIDVENLEPDITGQRIITLPSHVHKTENTGQIHRTDGDNTLGIADRDYDKDGQSKSQLAAQGPTERVLNELGPNTRTDGERAQSNVHHSSVDHRHDCKSEEDKTAGQVHIGKPDHLSLVLRTDGHTQTHGTDGPESLGSDPSEGRTVRPKHTGRTVRPSLGRTPQDLGRTLGPEIASLHGTDGQSLAHGMDRDVILLAPLQWQVWQLLETVTNGQAIISYRKIAKQVKSTNEGVRKAIRIIQKEGGFLTKEVVRTADEQGVRLTINPHARFRRGTLNEAKGILKRGLRMGQTPTRPSYVHGTDGPGMYVCINLNIRQTDVIKLLRIPPPNWNIREQTLLQIAESLPDMTALEFRLSLAYLVEQAKTGKEPIRHPNAWVKATFEKNGGPLVTEREIETRFSHPAVKSEVSQHHNLEREMNQEFDLMRRYLACSAEDRSDIDNLAVQMVAPLLKIVSDDKKSGILNEARISALKEFFSKRVKA